MHYNMIFLLGRAIPITLPFVSKRPSFQDGRSLTRRVHRVEAFQCRVAIGRLRRGQCVRDDRHLVGVGDVVEVPLEVGDGEVLGRVHRHLTQLATRKRANDSYLFLQNITCTSL